MTTFYCYDASQHPKIYLGRIRAVDHAAAYALANERMPGYGNMLIVSVYDPDQQDALDLVVEEDDFL